MPLHATAPGSAREQARALVRRHGWNATSFQTLEPGFRYWFDGDEACVAYVDTGRAWVAAGAPIAAPDRLDEIAARFGAVARAHGRRVSFFATEERFVRRSPGLRRLRIGEQPVWDPADWPAVVGRTASLRAQLRRAAAHEVIVRAVSPSELSDAASATRRSVHGLIQRWLATHPLPPMGFLVQVHPFSDLEERRCFVAERRGRIVGLLVAAPVYAREGWLFEHLARDPDAPNGTSDLLVDAGMRAAAAQGSRYVTLGMVPLAGPVAGWLRVARRFGRGLYDFEGLRAFKARLRPGAWAPVYLSYRPEHGPVRAVMDALTAFARGSLLRYGLGAMRPGA